MDKEKRVEEESIKICGRMRNGEEIGRVREENNLAENENMHEKRNNNNRI